MSDKDISKMDYKQLRNEVQELRDEISRMRRMYEDLLYNLDDSNFSSHIIKEKEGMKAEIKVNADEISTKVSEQEMQSAITQKAGEITSTVSETYETKTDAQTRYSTITQTANGISSRVSGLEGINETLFEQTNNKFYFDGEIACYTGCIILTDNDKNNAFTINHDESQGHAQVLIDSYDFSTPIIIGDYSNNDHNVYIGGTSHKVATQDWVTQHGTSTAVFG